VVRLNGKDHYLGRYGGAAAKAAYESLIAQWLAQGRQLLDPEAGPTVNDVMLAYDHHAEAYYQHEGQRSSELECMRDALRIVKALWGRTPASDFGPKKLKAVRQNMVEKGWCRTYVNHQVDRVRRVFRWAVAEELVPGSVYHGLQALAGIRRGMPGVRESKPVKPVPEPFIAATLPLLPPPIAAVVELQLLTGMRPSEALMIRACDLDMSGRVWIYRPEKHKTQHHGKVREIYIGPRGQEIIKRFLKLDTQAYLFSPADSEMKRNAQRRERRQTPLWRSHQKRRDRKWKRNRQRPPGDRYDIASYRRAIARACAKAFSLPDHLDRRRPPNGKVESIRAWRARLTADEKVEIRAWRRQQRWHPHQLRHSAATNLRKEFGVELTRIVLGHSTAFTTEIYAEADKQQAMEVIARIG
jgi:integrase